MNVSTISGKNYFFNAIFFFLLFCFSQCGNPSKEKVSDAISPEVVMNPLTASGNENNKLPEFDFTDEVYDFGNVIQGEKINYSFRFKNKGGTDLIIASSSASCGCIVADYPKNPIPPGEERMIKVVFNTDGRTGYQDKTITLVANTIPNTKSLKFIGNVLVPGK